MIGRSIRLRIITFAAIFLGIFLVTAAAGSYWLFQRHVSRLLLAELNTHFEELLTRIAVTPDGKIVASPPLSDPRFQMPDGGLYWQINMTGQEPLRSRSLWDEELTIPTAPASAADLHAHELQRPSGGLIFALERLVTVEAPDGSERKLIVTVGLDRDKITNAVTGFAKDSVVGFLLAFVMLMASAFLIIMLGLRPLTALRKDVEQLRTGKNPLPVDAYPEEVLPLVRELNNLVDARERQIQKVRQRAGNLAHGLKTPLTVLSAVAMKLQSMGLADEATTITSNTRMMNGLVERELARSRMADGSADHKTDLYLVASRVVDTARRAPGGEALIWDIQIPSGNHVRMDQVDLTELLGTLADNARKHAKTRIKISHNGKYLIVEDDGHGVPHERLRSIFERGTRLDERQSGSGIGLAIVSDLADAYGGDVHAEKSVLGGLAVFFALPSTDT